MWPGVVRWARHVFFLGLPLIPHSDRRGARNLHPRHRRRACFGGSRNGDPQEDPPGPRRSRRQGPQQPEGSCHAQPLFLSYRSQPAPVLTPTNQQDAIKRLIEARFDAVSGVVAQVPTPTSGTNDTHDTNGHAASEEDETVADDAVIEVSVSLPQPATKKQKRESSSEDADARLAAELQAQENRLSRGRVTRGAGTAKPAKTKVKAKAKPAKKKSAKRVRSDDDDSNADSDDAAGGKPKRKAGGGFQKPFNLSPSLADVCGESQVGFCLFLFFF